MYHVLLRTYLCLSSISRAHSFLFFNRERAFVRKSMYRESIITRNMSGILSRKGVTIVIGVENW